MHISDFHLKSNKSYDQDVVLDALIKSVDQLISRFGKYSFIIASGDIAFSGKNQEYDEATQLFEKLLAVSGLRRNDLFVIPGNHDIDRNKAAGLTRTLDTQQQADAYFAKGNPLTHIEYRLNAYKEWYDEYFQGIRKFDNKSTYDIHEIILDSKTVRICLFNSAAFCVDDYDSGKLFVGRRMVDEAAAQINESPADLKMAVMHHPFSWLSPIEATQTKSAIYDSFDVVLRGHLHENEIEQIAGSSGNAVTLAAGACYQTSKWPNTAIICRLENREVVVNPIKFVASPRPLWALDTSLFPNTPNYDGRYKLKGYDPAKAAILNPVQHEPDTTPSAVKEGQIAAVSAARLQLNERLFIAPSGDVVFAEPRIMPRSQTAALEQINDDAIKVSDIIEDDESYLIETRPEYGASTLCRLIHSRALESGHLTFLHNARDLPNYKRKLEEYFSHISKEHGSRTLILDDYDLERDEKMLSSLKETNIFKRVVLATVNRRVADALSSDMNTIPFKPKIAYLWGIGRGDIRSFANATLDHTDSITEGRAVDKVYHDLLSLRIPLTPSNVMMYLRVLKREGDFEPLSRVDILSRYLSESLRKPSDVALDSFNSKNKMDVLSAFANELRNRAASEFDQRAWLNFCADYQERTLSEFNAKEFFDELNESRIFGSYRGVSYFRYSFYFMFFVGRYLSPRPDELSLFFDNFEYMAHIGVIDVVTGLSSENSKVVTRLTEIVEGRLFEFSTKYVKNTFDPLVDAIWDMSNDEEEKIWKPVQRAIEAGPADSKKIDELKTSMLAEARTSNQQITFEKFTQLENALFKESHILIEALKNSDDVDGPLKVRAWKAALTSVLVVFQIGTMFAPELAKRKRFTWGGITFIDFNKAAEGLEGEPHEALISVITSLADAAVLRLARDAGSLKLAPVFRSLAASGALTGFMETANFTCLVTARGRNWFEAASKVIERTDKKAFYLSEMFNQMIHLLEYDVMPGRDRDFMKRLVATIQTKRELGKQNPGSKIVKKFLTSMEEDKFFPVPDDNDG